MKMFFFFLILLNFQLSNANSGPAGFNVQGVVTDTVGTPVTGIADFQFQVMDKNKTCILYQENFNSINLTTSSGVYSLNLGSGTSRTNNVDTANATTLNSKVFRNDINVSASGSCPSGVTMASGDARYLRILFNPGTGAITMSPDLKIQGAPYALIAESIQGKTPSNFVQVNAAANVNQANVESIFTGANYAQLVSLIGGTSTQYTTTSGSNFSPTGPVDFNNQQITNVATPTSSTQVANKSYTDSNIGGKAAAAALSSLAAGDSGKTLTWNGTQWTAQVASATDATKLPLAGGTMAGTITMGGNQILSTGHVTMNTQSTITIGRYTTVQETILTASLTTANKGATWFNTTTNRLMYWNGTQALQVSETASSVASVFSRTGAVTATAGDYTAAQITNTPAGNVSSTTTQLAINELDSDKLDKSGGLLTGNLQMNAQNQLRFADSDSSNYVAFRAPTTVSSNVTWILPGLDGTLGQMLTTNGTGTLAWSTPNNGDITDITTSSGSALSGGVTSGAATLSVVTDNSTLEVNGSNQLRVKDAGITDTKISALNISKLANGPGNYFSYMPAAAECANNEVLKWNAVSDRWECGTDIDTNLITSVFGRTGIVSATAGDYTATQITNTAAGNIAATTAQSAINELDSEKLDKSGGTLTGTLQVNAQNQTRYADSDSSNYAAIRSPATIATNYILTLPVDAGTSGQLLSTDGSGNLSWITGNVGDITDVVAGSGLTGGATSGSATLDIGAGTGIVVNANDVAVDVGVTTGKIIQVAASNKLPAIDGSNLTSLTAANLSGTVGVANGGTGQSTYTDGQLLIGNTTGNTLTKATLTAGSGVSITNGTGSITLASTLGTSVDLTSEVTGSLPGTQVATTAAGTLAATTAQDAVNELDTEKVAKAGDTMTGNLVMNAQNQLRLADSDSSNYVAFRSPATVAADVIWTLPSADGTSGQMLSTNGTGTMSWITPSLSGDVTGAHTATTVGKIQGRTVAATAPTDGQVLVWKASTSQWEPGPRRLTVTKAADESSTSTIVANVTDMVFPAIAGSKYMFTFYVLYQSAVATTGLKLGISVPAGTVSANASFRIAADGAGSLFDGAFTSNGDSIISTAVPVINTSYLVEVRGIFICTTSGNVQLTYGSEVNATSVTIKQNSVGVYETF